MAIYESSHPGMPLGNSIISTLNLSPVDIRGYFSKEDLNDILSPTTCVGIRIYNILAQVGSPKLLAVAVTENGFDMRNENHFFSRPTSSPLDANGNSAMTSSRRQASFNIDVNSEKFSSFFSKTMIQALIDNNSHSGVCFYKVTLGNTNLLTHLAVTTNIDSSGNIIGAISNTGFKNCLSDQPCPGHCVNKNTNGEFDDTPQQTPFAGESNNLGEPYIPVWQ